MGTGLLPKKASHLKALIPHARTHVYFRYSEKFFFFILSLNLVPCFSSNLLKWVLVLLIHELVFFIYLCKEIEENNRIGKTRDLFKKIRDTKGTFHAKMGSIKDRNSMDLTEAEDMKKRWQEYTEELYKKIFMTQIITMV